MEVFPRTAVFARPRAWRRLRIRQSAQQNPQGAQQSEPETLRALLQLQGIVGHFCRNPRRHLRRVYATGDSTPLLHEARRTDGAVASRVRVQILNKKNPGSEESGFLKAFRSTNYFLRLGTPPKSTFVFLPSKRARVLSGRP